MARNRVTICQPCRQLYSECIGQQCSQTSRSNRDVPESQMRIQMSLLGKKSKKEQQNTTTKIFSTFLSFLSVWQSCQFITLTPLKCQIIHNRLIKLSSLININKTWQRTASQTEKKRLHWSKLCKSDFSDSLSEYIRIRLQCL